MYIVLSSAACNGAGQQQLVCMARAMIRRPSVIVLDEATAHVDSQTAACLQQLLAEYVQQASSCAVIQIAHRRETVLQSAKVLVLEAGEIVEMGNAQQLSQDPVSKLSRLHCSNAGGSGG